MMNADGRAGGKSWSGRRWPRLGVLCLLAGCGVFKPLVPPQPAPPFVPPAAWSGSAGLGSATEGGAALVSWWHRFDDALLNRLIERALATSTSMDVARAALTQARATRDVAAAGLGTTVVGTASAQRNQVGAISPTNSYSVGFDAAWEPDVFGANRYALAAGVAFVQASVVGLADVQVSVAAEVARMYIELRAAQARLAIARDNLENLQATLRITRWRVQAGLLTALELQQAETAAELAEAQLAPLAAGQARLRHGLAVLCGQPPAALDAELAPPGPAPAIPMPGAELTLSLPAETLRQRPDVRAAEYQVSAALARVGQADAARYPSFRLGGSIGLRGLGLGGSGSTLLRALLASVTGSAVDGGAARATLQLQQGALAQAEAGYRATVLGALQEVEDGLASLDADRRQLEHLRRAASGAANAATLARQRYASGLADYQTVLETQRTLYATEDNVALAGAALGTDHVRLYKALGGGWLEAPAAVPSQP